uniref:Peptidase A2 domain-containing protein n=1 Tax=Nothobranchius furzeri TaxID=105023 RepID=A0A1A8V711_NOTFU
MQAGVRTRKGNKGEIKETVQQFDVGEMEDGAAVDLGDTEDEEIREPTLKDLTSILQTFMGQQDMRDKKREEESEQQEQRFKALQHQFHLLQMGMQARATPELGRDDSEQVGLSSDDYNQMVKREPEKHNSKKMTTVTINGQKIEALLDTGSTLVNRNCIPFSDWGMSEPITVCCVHGDEKSYPTADLCIGVQGATYLLKVGVADNLPYPVILGEDLPVIYDLLKEVESCNAAVTRAQAKTQSDQFTTLSSLPFFDSDVEGQPGKTLKACSQKRHEKLEYNVQRGQNEEAPDLPLGFTIPNDIRQMQQDDLTLSALLLKAKGETEAEYDTKRGRYILQHGILYHHHGQMK